VVWLADGVLHSPPPDPLGILAGITVRALFDAAGRHGFGTRWSGGTVTDLHAADGVWLVSSVRLAAPVLGLNGTPSRTDPAATARVQAAAGL
jgi:4-amino-4-deoxychorismate lyase